MKKLVLAGAFGALILPMMTLAAAAGPIEKACNRSDRSAANRGVCACIQQVADMTLSRADQRRAAKFFADADEAQQVRMSKSDSDNAFWARYKNFATTAEAYCAN